MPAKGSPPFRIVAGGGTKFVTGLRITHYRKKTVIAFVVVETRVEILGIFHGGRDYAAVLRGPE